MTCLRHSYEKGTAPKSGRVCRKCGQPDNVSLPTSTGAVSSSPADASSLGSLPSLEPTSIGPEPPKGPRPLPLHSRLGASGAERWMNCSASSRLIERVAQAAQFEAEDPDWTVEGRNAHSLAAHCLDSDVDAWQLMGLPAWSFVTVEMAMAVQVYLDYVRSLPGPNKRWVERRMHRPDIHPLFYGTLDCEVEYLVDMSAQTPVRPSIMLEIVDYKHGAGVLVEVENNAQTMYYANGRLIDRPYLLGSDRVKLTIVQPRGYLDEKVRSWVTTVQELRTWLVEHLVPAMQKTESPDAEFKLGEWCRFCPAKLVCPAYDDLARKVLNGAVLTYPEAMQLKMLIAAAKKAEYTALMNGEPGTGGKLVMAKVDRVFKPAAEAKLAETYGTGAYTAPKLLSPAAVEALPGGKAIVAEFAYKPEAGYSVAPLGDPRSAVTPKKPSELFGAVVQKVVDIKAQT